MMQPTAPVKRAFSGIQPTGSLHLGNYIGAIAQWVENQEVYDSIFCVVDLHALTIPENVNPQELRHNSYEVAALCIASGLDPNKITLFVQSHAHEEHAALMWLLNCTTPLGWLERMTQYKSKSKQSQSVSAGLLDYPVLQAADILLYDTDVVPVGEDQRQHIELTRDIATRFNNLFGETFRIPEVLIRDEGAKVMGFDAPDEKMSKSIGSKREGHLISLLDSPQKIKKTVSRAVTDPGTEVRFEFASPGVKNLLTIYMALSGQTKEKTEEEFSGKGYGHLKREVTAVIVDTLEPIQRRYYEITSDPIYMDTILKSGAESARSVASNVLQKAQQSTGIGRRA
jgi:tryptophanyl-tRNA synthetase